MTIDRRFSAGLFAATLAFAPDPAYAGAWTQSAGGLYNRTSANRYASDEQFDADRSREPLPLEGEFVDMNFVDYAEYGVTNRFTAIASFAVKRLRSDNLVREVRTWGIGDVDLALRTKLAEGSAGVASMQWLAKVPTGYDADGLLPLGTGEPEYEGRLLYGRSLWPLMPGYCGVEVGHRWRAGTPENEFRYLAEVGSDLGAGFYIRTKLDGVRGLKTGVATDASGNPTVRNSYDLGTLETTAGRRFGKQVSVEAGFAPGLYGRTTTSGSTVTLAVAFTMSTRKRDATKDPIQNPGETTP